MKVVNQPIMKKDAMALVTGKPVFTNDKAPKECLIVKLLRSPYANAMIKSINTQFAMKVPGIEAIYTWEDVPQERFTMAGQTYPELSHMTDRFWISMSVMLEILLRSLPERMKSVLIRRSRCYVWNTKYCQQT